MKISSAFPSNYLKASDIPQGPGATVNINEVRLEDVAGNNNPADCKPVLYFAGKTKGLVLNKTNSATIAAVYGDETEAWHGRPVTIFQSQTMYQGSMVACLRVMVPQQPGQQPPAQQAAPQQTPEQQAAAVADFDQANQSRGDDVPW